MATVLVIEDDAIILDNTLELLELEGFAVVGAENGCVGVKRAQEVLPDIVICDVLMPVLDGYGVLRELRANPQTAEIPLIFVSATPREDVIAASNKLGMVSEFLVKPFRADDLIRVIRTLLGDRTK